MSVSVLVKAADTRAGCRGATFPLNGTSLLRRGGIHVVGVEVDQEFAHGSIVAQHTAALASLMAEISTIGLMPM
jgi:hypothetical protein